MSQKFQRFLDRLESRWTLLTLIGGTGIVSGVSAWLARRTEWLSAYAPLSWWVAALVCGLLFAALFLLTAWGWKKLAERNAFREWSKRAIEDGFNPLDSEFHKKRMRWESLGNPVSRLIEDKEFTNCELLGPANIVLIQDVTIAHVTFSNCDFVLLKDQGRVYNVLGLRKVTITGGMIANTTVFVHPNLLADFVSAPGINFVTPTTEAEFQEATNAKQA